MAGVWHKCLLCDCEFFDKKQVGYLGYCPSCRDSKYPKIIIRKREEDMSNNKIDHMVEQFPSPDLQSGFDGTEPSPVTQADGSEPADEKGGL